MPQEAQPPKPTTVTAAPTAGRRDAASVRRIWWRVIGAITVVMVLTAGFAGVSLYRLGQDFDTRVQKLSDPFAASDALPAVPPTSTGPVAPSPSPVAGVAQNILLLGSDTRGTFGNDIADVTAQRSDTIMLVHVPADRQNVFVMSIMRDSWLNIPGHGDAKVNAALSLGGVPLAVQTVEGLLGIHVDHVAVIDFAGLQGVTDALGGISLWNDIGFVSSKIPGHYFAQGLQNLNGEETLAYVRERYAFNDGDFQRVRNQQLVIKGMMKAVSNADTITTPGKLNTLIDALTPFIASDDTFTSAYLAGLALELYTVRYDDVTFFTMPSTGTGISPDGQSIVNIDYVRLDPIRQGLAADTLTPAQALE